jgi:hypothetical protein
LLAQQPLDKLIELGAVRDPDGKRALRVVARELVSEDETTQRWRFYGIGAQENGADDDGSEYEDPPPIDYRDLLRSSPRAELEGDSCRLRLWLPDGSTFTRRARWTARAGERRRSVKPGRQPPEIASSPVGLP